MAKEKEDVSALDICIWSSVMIKLNYYFNFSPKGTHSKWCFAPQEDGFHLNVKQKIKSFDCCKFFSRQNPNKHCILERLRFRKQNGDAGREKWEIWASVLQYRPHRLKDNGALLCPKQPLISEHLQVSNPDRELENNIKFQATSLICSGECCVEWMAEKSGWHHIKWWNFRSSKITDFWSLMEILRGSRYHLCYLKRQRLHAVPKIPRDREKYLELSPDGKAASEESGFFCIRGTVESIFAMSI